ncbi:YkgJ family cysteine cluster protein [Thiofilum flexile]|uniref:YkgJ family cysteine cluster protein n=1 Tax=Thiofilum flexile TaxID=125627 RepID=UPI0003714938
MASNPCLACGACCASFRVSFYWGETTASPFGTVPAELTEPITITRVAMRGTNQNHPHCIALQGVVGQTTQCGIYEQRASTCREFTASWEDGKPNESCDKARTKYGLPPLPCPADFLIAAI